MSRAHYDSHQNAVDDPGYRRFLARLAVPLLERLAPGSRVLDYGRGPGPALARMLGEAGHDVRLYDPLIGRTPPCSRRPTMRSPAARWRSISGTDGGVRPASRTVAAGRAARDHDLLQTDDASFADWHYRRDPTHVAFYREATLRHVAASWASRSRCRGRTWPSCRSRRALDHGPARARFAAVLDIVQASGARTVLDLGCGDGALLLRLAEAPCIGRLVGIDQAPGALRPCSRSSTPCRPRSPPR